jgi:hypothetical protein
VRTPAGGTADLSANIFRSSSHTPPTLAGGASPECVALWMPTEHVVKAHDLRNLQPSLLFPNQPDLIMGHIFTH